MIALEGGWGSGKTTIINLVRKDLKEYDHIHVFCFDAWAHEGDPLRRTYLESLIRELRGLGWINADAWNKALLELAQRQKTTTTTTTQRPSTMALAAGAAALLVPLGVALLTKSLDDLTLAFGRPPEWKAIVGLPLSVGPLLVVLAFWLKHKCSGVKGTFSFAFTEGRADTETKSETSETPDPTSIEFEDRFQWLMREALPEDPNRSLVIVLDNLDRVKVEDALKVWATLQTFIQHRNQPAEPWFKRVSILVPYDSEGLRRLWSKPGVDSSPDSFMDKSFQMRFDVPPMLLSNWKAQLVTLLSRAFPDHSPDDYEMIYRVFAIAQSNRPAPTPRELVLYVNQIGAIHRQWQHEFPISHVAYYASERRRLDQSMLREGLESGNLITGPIKTVLSSSEDLLGNVAGLLFNVRASLGMQLLLSAPIVSALRAADAKKLEDLESVHKDGFWAVLEKVATEQFQSFEQPSLEQAAICLDGSGILSSNRFEAKAVKQSLAEVTISVEKWSVLDATTFSGVSALCRLMSDVEVTVKVVDAVRRSVEDPELLKAPAELVRSIVTLCQSVTALGHDQALNRPFLMAFEPATWIATSPVLREAAKRWWPLIRPASSLEEINETLGAMIEAGEFSSKQLDAIELARFSHEVRSWKSLVRSLTIRLKAEAVNKGEVGSLLHCLAAIRADGDSQVDDVLQDSAHRGYLSNLLSLTQSLKDWESTAWCIVTYLKVYPDAPQPPVLLQSAEGHRQLVTILTKGNAAWVGYILSVMKTCDDAGLPWRVIEARGFESLMTACLKAMVDQAEGAEALTADSFISKWRELEVNLNEGDSSRFAKLIKALCSAGQLIETVQRNEFDPNEAALYREILECCPSSSFEAWLRRGLDAITRDNWKTELAGNGAALVLAMFLATRTYTLKASFADALVDFAKEVATGARQPIDQAADFVGILDPSLRGVLPERFYLEAIPKDGNCVDGFFQMFGGVISEERAVRAHAGVFALLLSPLIRDRKIAGLRWLLKLLHDHPLLLEGLDTDRVQEFKERLREQLDPGTESEDEFQQLVIEVSRLLGVGPRPTDDEPGGDVDNAQSRDVER